MTTKIPQTDSITELAAFWDAHDVTEFDELEEVTEPIFKRNKQQIIAIALDQSEAAALQLIAQQRGVAQTELVRAWVQEKLRAA